MSTSLAKLQQLLAFWGIYSPCSFKAPSGAPKFMLKANARSIHEHNLLSALWQKWLRMLYRGAGARSSLRKIVRLWGEP
jgi:hypothetical protein